MTQTADFHMYKDKETSLYVAEHQGIPVSSCGKTEQEALENVREALELCEEPEGTETPNFDLGEPKYSRDEMFLEDLSYMDEDAVVSEFVKEHQSVFGVRRVLRDEKTGEILYYLQSTKGFETKLVTEEELDEMDAYQHEEDV